MMKRYLTTFTIFTFLTILRTVTLYAQTPEIVVSEYKTNGTEITEWTELLVIKDNLTLVGYSVRDNSQSDSWQGGIRFNDVRLWRNLRAGTIIVINHRSNGQTDENAKDGYIEVQATNTTLFTQFMDNSGGTWDQRALNLNATADIVQIRDNNNNHIHSLSHGKSTDPDFLALPSNAVLNHSTAANGILRVYPGLTISDYISPNSGDSKTEEGTTNDTKGLPNKSNSSEDNNFPFWRKTREPEWDNPTIISTSVTNNSVKLTWNPITDPNPTDEIQGFIILTTDDSNPDTNVVPTDGTSYIINQTIGDWRIVDFVPASITTYDDFNNFKNIPCGGSYKYRVFAFRFAEDDINGNLNQVNQDKLARGRQYLTDKFASGRARKPPITKPDVTFSGGVLVGQTINICQGSTLTFTSTNATEYQWIKDGQPLTNQTARTLAVTQSGRYYVEVKNDVGCTTQSDDLVVEFVPIPVATIKQGKSAKICAGQSIQLEAAGGTTSYTWYKDKTVVSGQNGSVITVNQPGDYTVSTTNPAGCTDTSDIISVTVRTTVFTMSASLLDFGELDGCRSSKDATLEVNNTGNDTLRITTVNVPADFTLAFPPLPLIIAPTEKQNIIFRFSKNSQGISTGKAVITAIPCSTSQEVELKATKLKPDYSADRSEIVFADKLTCEIAEQDSVFNITNNGQDPLIFTGYNWNLKPPFSVTERFPDRDVFQPGGTVRIRVRYTPPAGAAVYQDELKIPYTAGSCKDTMRIVLKAQRKKPELSVVGASEINFKQLLGCDKTVLDSIVIKNNSKQPVFISKQPKDTTYRFINLPDTIQSGALKTIIVRFTPENEGDYSAFLPLFVEGCDDTALVIPVKGNKKSATATLSSPITGIDFGEVYSCDTLFSASDTVRLSLANFSGDVTIEDVKLNAPFFTNIVKGQNVTSGESIIIRFNPRFDQNYRDTLHIKLQPCNISRSIPLIGKRLPSVFQWTKNFDFGTVDTGQSRTQKVFFKNTSRTAITFQGLEKLESPPFTVKLTDKPLPAIIQPNDSIAITIEYSPKSVKRDSIIANFSISTPCDTTFSITLKGSGRAKGVNPGANSATFFVENTKGKPGERFKINVVLRSPDTAKFSLLKVYRVELGLTYNNTVMMPLSAKIGQSQIGFRTTVTETAPGKMTLVVEHPSAQNASTFITDGRIAEIEALAMLGDAISTQVSIVEDNIAGNAVKPTDISYGSGILTLTDVCNLDGRLIEIGGQPGITIASQSNNGIDFHFENVSSDYTAVEVFTFMGEKVGLLAEGTFIAGIHNVHLPTHSLANGAYYAVYKAGIFTYTLPFFISH